MPDSRTQIARVVCGILRALSAGPLVALCAAPPVLAQAPDAAALTADIPAQPMTVALAEFARQTGLQLVYVSEILRSQTSRAVAAGTSAPAALTQMLQGSGLEFQFLTARSVRILAAKAPSAAAALANVSAVPEPEVIVTANRREENIEDVAITIQTLNGAQLQDLGITTLSNLLHYTPNVTYSGNGPATGNIFIRGLGFGASGNQSQATTAPFTNVALYLDEQPMQFPSRNNDVYMVDMERIEVLEGPQGTLFGGGAQAGAIVYITNKPKLDTASGEFSAGYGTTAGGSPNSTATAMLNVPLIADTLALRGVVFSERQGGYISNVPSTISYAPGSAAAATGAQASNAGLAAPDTNPVQYQGARLSLLWKLNDDWSLLLQQNYQDLSADGYFYAYPQDSNGTALQPYQIAAFAPAYSKDRYESTAWTLKGEVGPVSAIYTGSYLIRHIEAQADYSNYLRSNVGSYYNCIGPGAGYFYAQKYPALLGTKFTCYPPVAHWNDTTINEHQSHELRFSTDPHARLRGLIGGFWEKFAIFDRMSWDYSQIPQCGPAGSATLTAALAGGPACLSEVGPLPGSYARDSALVPDAPFGEDIQRGYRQTAFFASVDYDLIPKVLTLTAGTRHYRYDEFEAGSVYFSQTTSQLLIDHPNGACTQAGACGYPIDLTGRESGFVNRGNLTWHVTPDVMAYYTFSQGFRPAGFNRTYSIPGEEAIYLNPRAPYCAAGANAAADPDPRCRPGGSLYGEQTDQYVLPAQYRSDTLRNNEIGLKSEWLEHRLIANVSAYIMSWNNVQWAIADFVNLGTLGFVANGPSYTIKGAELQLSARPLEGLSVDGSLSVNGTRQTDAPCLQSAGKTVTNPDNPTPAGQCITTIHGLPYTNPWGQPGSTLPFSSPLQFSLRGRYEFKLGAYRPFVMLSASHISEMPNEPGNYPVGDTPAEQPPTTGELKYTIPGYTTYDGALGVSKDNWTLQLMGSNLWNSYGPANVSDAEFIKAVLPLRPRTLMLSVICGF